MVGYVDNRRRTDRGGQMTDYELRLGAISLGVWRTWTKAGAELSGIERDVTMQAAKETTARVYGAFMDDAQWRHVALATLGPRPVSPEH
jgi:hypothetical protein